MRYIHQKSCRHMIAVCTSVSCEDPMWPRRTKLVSLLKESLTAQVGREERLCAAVSAPKTAMTARTVLFILSVDTNE